MKTYLRILRYVKPYWLTLSGSLVCILVFTLFSGASLVSVVPFLNTLFNISADRNAGNPPARPEQAKTFQLPASLSQRQQQFLRAAYQWLLGGDRRHALLRLCVVILILIFLKNLFDYFQAYLMARVEQGIIMDLRNDLYRHLNELSLSYFNRMRTGQLISRITNDVTLVNGGVSAGFVTLVKNPLLILAYLGMAFYLSWRLTLAALLILPTSFLIIGYIGTRLRRASTLSQEKMAEVTSVLQETISGVRVVKAFAMEDFEIRKFQRVAKDYFKALLHITRVSKIAGPLTEFLGAMVGIGILWFGGQQVLTGQGLSPGAFMLFLLAIFSVMQPVKELSSVNSRLQEAIAAGDRIFAILDLAPEVVSLPGAQKVERFDHSIRFEHVSFAYDNQEQNAPTEVLRDISFEVRKGAILAIVGPSGAGKSTLVDLLPRFYDPQQGRILLDGIDLREIEVKSLRSLMGIVTQETILFHDTVRNNIAYGLQEISEEKLVQAAKAANAHRFITEELPRGYDTVIGERGTKLSGGQRQRLAIARALLKNPPILILDEATSALDSESEMLVQQAIERLMINRTSFVIAHRLSTILHANQIIVIDKGRIVQRGTHDELLAQKGIYQKLYKMQFRA
ncbi:MAG: ABC transporter ATP-binding protein/permease [candidate division KSB1 bacterium]|nr:ABC transporter ATP-binding protein/permease [candidate division KSB1 bacterium]MDZ7303409.1 ABC transporter ATP-binding protein/permease [candidate division KSB1 bacterium]MDZ7312273.1 ABC transporter ATP-binding protein/permease [candidate division KSB1 bacterium]